jgi:hypothetical protein
MYKQSTTTNYNSYPFGEAAFAASRQMWLAGLGATIATRDWVKSEARPVFKTLVKQGTAVESRAIRFVGDRIESSVTRANVVWKQARRTVEATMKQAATTAVNLAQQVLPVSLPKIELPKILAKAQKPATPVKRVKKTVKARATRTAKKAKRTTKRA